MRVEELKDAAVFRHIVASMGEGIVFADSEGRICFVNAAAEAIRNIRAANFLGRNILEIHPPRSAERIGELLENFKRRDIPQASRTMEVRGRSFENGYYPIRDEKGRYVGTLMISRDITEKRRLSLENHLLRDQIRASRGELGMIATSRAMQPVLQLVQAVAALDSTVLVTGESGTGKELVALALHRRSPRRNAPMVKINCAALPESLLEAELFGHEKGAFTGAACERRGKFEQAQHGTIFLDEIGEIPLSAQAKLLRVLQEKTVERIGGRGEIAVDVRIVAATNRDLRREMEAGRFREDLFYRLNVIPVHLPPLRERREDIFPLAELFLRKFATLMHKPMPGMSVPVRQALLDYAYPGNVRELENALERAVALCGGETLTLEDLPAELALRRAAAQGAAAAPAPAGGSLAQRLAQAERQILEEALRAAGGKKGAAAVALGISRKTLWEKLKKGKPT